MAKPPQNWEQQDEGVWLLRSGKAGPTVGVLGGVHGNEPAGAVIIKEMVTSMFEIEHGNLIAMIGSPPAVEANKHYIDFNLNRAFLDDEDPNLSHVAHDTYEYKRSRLLLPYMRKCHALLDLHQHYGPQVPPFIICERESIKTANYLGAPVVAFGFNKTEPGGSDSYMHGLGREGLCYELGANLENLKGAAVARGHDIVNRFLGAQGLKRRSPTPATDKPMLVETEAVYKRIEGEYWIDPALNTFDRLTPGKLIAINGGKGFWAQPDQMIIFPDPEAVVGDEAFTIGRIVTE